MTRAQLFPSEGGKRSNKALVDRVFEKIDRDGGGSISLAEVGLDRIGMACHWNGVGMAWYWDAMVWESNSMACLMQCRYSVQFESYCMAKMEKDRQPPGKYQECPIRTKPHIPFCQSSASPLMPDRTEPDHPVSSSPTRP